MHFTRLFRFDFFILLIILLNLVTAPLAIAGPLKPFSTGSETKKWIFPSIGSGNGDWEISTGIFFWSDKFWIRNLQLRADVDIAPGIRWHSLIRSDGYWKYLDDLDLQFDENFIEFYGFRPFDKSILSTSLKVGTTRYLRFPYPDNIAVFDQVPGIGDLKGGPDTGYSGGLLTLDYSHESGWSIHSSMVQWGFGRESGFDVIEAYLGYGTRIGRWDLEARLGRLAIRPEPLGEGAPGFNIFLGTEYNDHRIGFLYEDIDGQEEYTGIMVKFAPDRNTRFLGEVAADYARTPQGLAAHLTLAKGTIGRVKRITEDELPLYSNLLVRNSNGDFVVSELSHEPGDLEGYHLVGEIVAERIRTYWQNSQVRNFYEHRLSSWGETSDKELLVVMVEHPRYLDLEALVSPNTSFGSWDDLKEWERERQGPAQLSRKVTYKFYRKVSESK